MFRRGSSDGSCLVAIMGVMICLPLIGVIGRGGYRDYEFNRDIGGFIATAAQANSLELAKSQLDIAISAVEKKGLTTGSTTVCFDNQQNNITYWYSNLKACQKDLAGAIEAPQTPLQTSNVLIKLKESLMTHSGDSGEVVKTPPGIGVYPDNTNYCVAYWIFGLLAGVGILMVIITVW